MRAYRLSGFKTQATRRMPCCSRSKFADVDSCEGRLYATCHICEATFRVFFAGWR